ncbi:MAG: class I SAM-dependent methyltransferase [Actinomycetota bacterium]
MDELTQNLLFHDHECSYYDERFGITYDRAGVAQALRELRHAAGVPLARVRRAVDIGCGTGYLGIAVAASELAEEVFACDLSAGMLGRCGANATRLSTHVTRVQSEVEHLPFADKSIDLVVGRGIIHHVPDPVAGLAEVRRILVPGGLAVFTSEPTAMAERTGGIPVQIAWRTIESVRKALGRDAGREEHKYWELAAMAANLHTFEPGQVEEMGRRAGLVPVRVGTGGFFSTMSAAAGYFLTGEFPRLGSSGAWRSVLAASWRAFSAIDRAVCDQVVPAHLLHTVQASFRAPVSRRVSAARANPRRKGELT